MFVTVTQTILARFGRHVAVDLHREGEAGTACRNHLRGERLRDVVGAGLGGAVRGGDVERDAARSGGRIEGHGEREVRCPRVALGLRQVVDRKTRLSGDGAVRREREFVNRQAVVGASCVEVGPADPERGTRGNAQARDRAANRRAIADRIAVSGAHGSLNRRHEIEGTHAGERADVQPCRRGAVTESRARRRGPRRRSAIALRCS